MSTNPNLYPENAPFADPSGDTEGSWDGLYEAVIIRWPDVPQLELRSCPCDVDSLTAWIASRTGASRETIEPLVREHAPSAGKLHAVKESAAQMAHKVSDSAQSLYYRAEDGIAESPMRAASIAFLTGLVTGSLLTALYFQSREEPEPTMWENLRTHRWR